MKDFETTFKHFYKIVLDKNDPLYYSYYDIFPEKYSFLYTNHYNSITKYFRSYQILSRGFSMLTIALNNCHTRKSFK